MRPRIKDLVSVLFFLILFGCGPVPESNEDPIDNLLSQLGPTTMILKSVSATISLDRGYTNGTKIVKDCLAFYDPDNPNMAEKNEEYFSQFGTFLFDDLELSRDSLSTRYGSTTEYLENVCHQAWLRLNQKTPWLSEVSNEGLRYTLLRGDRVSSFEFDADSSPALVSVLGPSWKENLLYNTDFTMLDAWPIARKITAGATTRQEALYKILRWFKSTLVADRGAEDRLKNSGTVRGVFQYVFNTFSATSTYEASRGLVLRDLLQSVGIPCILLKTVFPYHRLSTTFLWLPEENKYIPIDLITDVPALSPEKLMIPPWVFETSFPLELYAARLLDGLDGLLFQAKIRTKKIDGEYFSVISLRWGLSFENVSPREISVLKEEFPEHVRDSKFIPVPIPLLSALQDPRSDL